MAGSGQDFELQLPDAQRVAVIHGNMGKRRSRFPRQINYRPGSRRQLAMPRNEVGMKVRLEDVPDRQTLLLRRFHVDVHIALRIDDDPLALRPQ